MDKRLKPLWLSLLILLGCVGGAVAAEKTPAQDVWLTGEVFTKDNVLLFRPDKSVKGVGKEGVVMLGATKQGAQTLLPAYMRAAEKRMKLRLYGSLLPFSGSIPGYSGKLPGIQFITWKVHLPEEPDELPASQKVMVK